MVIDTSAIAAILFDEPERAHFGHLIAADPVRVISAVTRVETTCVIEGRKGVQGRRQLDRFFSIIEVEIASVTAAHAELACEAFRRYGRGRHAAALNIGDCFAYALSKATGEPLLCKGDDFPQTDVVRVA